MWLNSVHLPPFLLGGGGGGLNLQPNFQKGGGGLDRTSILEEVAGKEGVIFFREGCNLKKKWNLKYFMTKKVYKQKYFSLL